MDNLIRQCSFIAGQWLPSEQLFPVTNPANNQTVIEVYDAGAAGAVTAVEAAYSAMPSWSKKTAQQRADLMLSWFALIMEHQDELARLLTLEQGKPLAEAKGEVSYGASFLQWFAEEGKRVYGDIIPQTNDSQRLLVLKQPVGVVTAITPWNFPNAMIMRKAAAALAAGCSFVVRPDPQTPLSALALAALAEQAGIPAGVFNVIVSEQAQAVGEVLTTHPKVAKFTFTGSTQVGKLLMSQCSQGIKKVSMELGGNAPLIVFDDADLELAVQGAIQSKYRNAGQTCICTNRIYVHNRIREQFTERYVAAVKQLKLGDGLREGIDVGPLISEKAVDRMQSLIDDSLAMGATLVTGGRGVSKSNFFEPTVLTNVTDEMPVAGEEIFGPISPIIGFDDEAEVISSANAVEVGLAAYFYSENIRRIWRVAEQLAFGMVGINDTAISNAVAPFGGIKQSGFGREGSKYGLDDYLVTKYLCLGSLSD
ncbi:NAD-dependent succinate-semialdehyde dehydrogenase [Thalassotalea euphylliae]|uniref:NAD-dependent succinate-semialdehyde dehydrogenase n=1 Tax=Thalassotalea euphylliae TaxID=1655234 RepID=A0A3E0UCI8_9GAMM|nr:NAD-dependent succinate-semialdehyde dehydrogenase [Thalassotalea euphylliae]REL34721.1 NAD-dependent succinate-semialdehyde dehydrogenase [Thalassotalea euphylliae]